MKHKLYSNENIRLSTVNALRDIGYDVQTSYEAGQANQGIPDNEVIEYAKGSKRAILTYNRKDYIKLHKQINSHSGIVVCREHHDDQKLARRIHATINNVESLDNKLLRVTLED